MFTLCGATLCSNTISLGEPEWAGPADGSHQGNVCQEAGDDEEDELCGGLNLFNFLKFFLIFYC